MMVPTLWKSTLPSGAAFTVPMGIFSWAVYFHRARLAEDRPPQERRADFHVSRLPGSLFALGLRPAGGPLYAPHAAGDYGACAWYGAGPYLRRPLLVFGLLVLAHLGQSAAYWLYIDAPRAYQANQNWPLVDRLAEEIRRSPGEVAIEEAAEPECQGLWLELDWRYRLHGLKQNPGPTVMWIVEPGRKETGPWLFDSPRRRTGAAFVSRGARGGSPGRGEDEFVLAARGRRHSLKRRFLMSPLLLQEPAATRPFRLAERVAPAMRFLDRTDVRLGIVLIVCLIPRAIAAWRLPAVCDDAYYYLHVADSLQRGALARAMEYLNINVYPLVLIALYRLGLDWIVAAKLWGVVMGTAIVLPLFDWLRRMFNERISLLGVFLYAVHPRIVEPTVEPLREATFWFFFVLCLDLFWRAAGERRWWQFAAGGLSLALALHTRMEAWFLLAPVGAWMATAWWRTPAARGRLACGTLLSLAVTPLFILMVNVTLLSHHHQWEWGRLSPFLLVSNWVRTPAGNEAVRCAHADGNRAPRHRAAGRPFRTRSRRRRPQRACRPAAASLRPGNTFVKWRGRSASFF